MKSFILKVALLCIIIVVIDFGVGLSLERIANSITIGGQGRDNYIANKVEEDVLVFGSSRAVHHYNPEILENGLGMTCYNCGDDGAGVILALGRLLMIRERHQPKVIIYDVNPSFDLEVNDNHKYLGWLKSHYDKDCIKPVFYSVDKKERFKMMSYLYRYNSRFLQNLIVYVTNRANDDGIKGYRPLNGNLDRMRIKNPDPSKDERLQGIDTLKMRFLNQFVDSCDGAYLFFVVSPIWYGMDSVSVQPIKDLCHQKGIPFLDFSNDLNYVHHDEFFKDGVHMNSEGADKFTEDLVVRIEPYVGVRIY